MKLSSSDPETRALERYLRRPSRRRLAAFVRACQDHAWSVAQRLTGHPDDAADLCQDVFLGLLHHPPPAGSVRSARGWFAARLATVARDRRRSAERRLRREFAGAHRLAAAEALDADELEAVRSAVEKLPERLRTVTELRYFAGLTLKEVAEAAGIAEPTVDKDLRRAREILRRRLGKLVQVLSVLGAAFPTARAAVVPAEIAGRWLHAVDWSSSLFPLSTPAVLEAVVVKKTIAALAAVVLVAAWIWYAVSVETRPHPPGTAFELPVAAPAPTGARPLEAAPAATQGVKLVAAPAPDPAVPASAAEPASTGSLRVKVLWGGDGSPATALGMEVWPRWCDNAIICGSAGVTGDDGLLVIDGLVPGEYSLRTVLGSKVGERGSVAAFEVSAGEETPLLIRIEGDSVRGIVVDSADQPVPGAAIWLSAGAFDPIGGDVVAHSGPTGEFELRGVGAQGLYASARAPGFAPSSQLVIAFRAKGSVLRLVLPSPGGAVRGRVLGPDAQPVQDAWVLVGAREFGHGAHVQPAPPARSRTDATGGFLVEGLAPGRAPIVVRSSLYAPAESAAEVEAGRVAELVVVLAEGASVLGSVVDAAGRPVGRAQVRLGDSDDAAAASDLARLSARTKEDGSFVFEGAPAGKRQLSIDAAARGRDRRSVLLKAGETTQVDVTLRVPLDFTGRLRLADGSPLASAMVVVWPGGQTAMTDNEGRFVLEALEDVDHELHISEPRAQIAGIRRAGIRPGPQELEIVVADGERASGRIAGKVIDPDGRAVRGAYVLCESVDLPGQAERGRTGPFGAFELERLPAGTYRVRVDAEGHPRIWAGDVSVARGEQIELGSLSIPRPGFLVASVTRLDGGPKEEVYYGVVDPEGRSALAVKLSSEPLRRDPLVAGKYRLIIRVPEAPEVVREVHIEAGKETRLDVELQPPREGRP